MKHRALVLAGLLMLLVVTVLAADDDRTPSTRPNPPGVPQEGYSLAKPSLPAVPDYLIEQHKSARESGNEAEAQRLEALISTLQPPLPLQKGNADPDQFVANDPSVAFGAQYSTNDVLVYSGVVKSLGYRQLDMKRGEDGNLYLAVNHVQTSYTGRVDVYKSTNGGAAWTFIGGLQSATAYFGEISMLVETRSTTVMDSTRIILFYTRAATADMANAAIRYASFLRDGTAFLGGASDIETPGAGRKFGSPSALSDGAYYATATYLGVVAAEYSNDLDSTKSLRVWQTTNWGTSFTGVTLTGTLQDWYPTAALKAGANSTTDSVYIAVERRFNTTNYLVRVIATKWLPLTASEITYFLPPIDAVSKYEKPYVHIRQTGRAYGSNRDVIITAVKNGGGIYHMSTGPTVAWSLDANLATSVNVKYSFCSSDSLTAGGGYFLAAYTDVNGDTLGFRRGVPGSLGTRIYRNSNKVSPSVMPVTAIYKVGATKYSAYAYAAFGPNSIYFNQENLPTAVKTDGPLPLEYGLDQNYPNPFNPETFIGFRVAQAGPVKLQVFDLLGREVAVLVNEQKDPGGYQVRFDGSGLPSGVYLYRLTAGSYVEAKKLVLVR
jgi:hypothetical protein